MYYIRCAWHSLHCSCRTWIKACVTLVIASAVNPIETVSGGDCVLERFVNRAESICSVDRKAFEDSAKAWNVEPGWIYNSHHQLQSKFWVQLTKMSSLGGNGIDWGIAWYDCQFTLLYEHQSEYSRHLTSRVSLARMNCLWKSRNEAEWLQQSEIS